MHAVAICSSMYYNSYSTAMKTEASQFRPDPALYPFTPHFLPVSGGRMHYVDEGAGEPILFAHGIPTWSFLYRDQITELSKNYRCIAPDHIGFGLSDKPQQWDYTLQSHSANIERLADHLKLDNITLVVHDFGGPIGLSFALRRPDIIRRIVLFNTWLWETASEKKARRVDRLLHTAFGKCLYLSLNISPRLLLRQAFHDKGKLTRNIHRHYTNVFPERRDRYGLLRMGQELVGASDWLDQQWQNINRIAGKPSLLLWGRHDPFLGEKYLRTWQSALVNARTVSFDSGHFVQEEYAAEATREIGTFMRHR